MAFPDLVSEKVLLDCGRCCCICHKFCGFKIELHHIIQKAEGGADTYENCIPLCFDCHAEVKAYNPRHPKGRKYTDSELKQHRDRWYGKVTNKSLVFINPNCIELDQKLFLKIRRILPISEGSIYFMRNHRYSNHFLSGKHDDLEKYIMACKSPDFEFIDVDLEIHRSQLTNSINEFNKIYSTAVFPVKQWTHEYPIIAIYPELKHDDYQRYYDIVKTVEDAATRVCDAYDNLIRIGRRRLAVD